jgi:hypothetical protein
MGISDGYMLDPATLTWSPVTLPPSRSRLNVVAPGADGRLYFFEPPSTTWSFDGSWNSTVAPRRIWADYLHAATGSDGLIYSVAETFDLADLGWVQAYDPVLDQRTTLRSMSTARSNFALASLGDRIYVVGGTGYTPDTAITLKTVDTYDVTTGTWSSVADLPLARQRLGAAGGPDGRLYAIGGSTDMIPGTTAVDAYDPIANRWTPVSPLTFGRNDPNVAVGPDGRIYVLSGYAPRPPNRVDAYGPIVALTPPHAPAGTTVVLTGSNFAANAVVSIFWGPTGALLETGATNASGVLVPRVPLVVPATASGDATLTVVDDKSQYPVKAFFTVD